MTAAAPTITSITFDKDSYAPGEDIQATVHYTAGASDAVLTFTGTATNQQTGETGQMQGTFSVQNADPTVIAVNDTGSREWTKVSDDGAVAVFTAKA